MYLYPIINKHQYFSSDPGPHGIEVPDDGGDIPASMLQPCLDDMFHMQQVIRSEREKILMSQLGLSGVYVFWLHLLE